MKNKLVIVVSCLMAAAMMSFVAQKAYAADHHPAIHHAIDALEEAKTELQHADHDFGGHRAAAIEECDKALFQLREALKYDR